MDRHIPILSYFNYLSVGGQIRFAGTILRAPADMLYVGNENTVFQHIKNLYKLYMPHFFKNAVLEVKYKGFFTLVNIDYKGNFVVMLPEDSEEFLIDDIRMRLVVKNFGYSVYVPNMYHQRLYISDYKYGLISDIDDTIIHTGATTILPRLKQIIFTRLYRKYARNIPPPFERRSQNILRIQQRSQSFPGDNDIPAASRFSAGGLFFAQEQTVVPFPAPEEKNQAFADFTQDARDIPDTAHPTGQKIHPCRRQRTVGSRHL